MYQMDETDYEILEIFKGDGRCSYSDIAEQVHLSRVAVRERINNMKEGGVIRGFTVVIDAKAYQRLAGVFMDIEVEPGKMDSVAHQVAAQEEVAVVSQHTGTTGLHVHAYIDSPEKSSQLSGRTDLQHRRCQNVQTQLLIRQYKTNSYLARYQECRVER